MKSLAELQAIRDRVKSSVVVRENNDVDYRIVVGMATCGIAAGARPVLNAASEEVAKMCIRDSGNILQVVRIRVGNAPSFEGQTDVRIFDFNAVKSVFLWNIPQV